MNARFTRSARATWQGNIVGGSGAVTAGSGAFEVAVTFPTVRGEAAGTTTPEELLAASHAACYAIGVRSVIARSGGSVLQVTVTATITAEKGEGGIRVRHSHLEAVLDGLQGVDPGTMAEIGRTVEQECTISNAIRGAVTISHVVTAADDEVHQPGG